MFKFFKIMNLKFNLIVLLLVFSIKVNAQIVFHELINKDLETDCSFIKSGKFVNEENDSTITKDYTIEYRGNYVIEKIENGKYFLKSEIKYTSNCSYEIKVLETNLPNYEDEVGKKFYGEILETSKIDKLIKIRAKRNEWKVFVFRKIEN